MNVSIENSFTVDYKLLFNNFPSPGLRPPSPTGRGFVFSLALRERGRGEGKKLRLDEKHSPSLDGSGGG
jgi:hypothetical protein